MGKAPAADEWLQHRPVARDGALHGPRTPPFLAHAPAPSAPPVTPALSMPPALLAPPPLVPPLASATPTADANAASPSVGSPAVTSSSMPPPALPKALAAPGTEEAVAADGDDAEEPVPAPSAAGMYPVPSGMYPLVVRPMPPQWRVDAASPATLYVTAGLKGVSADEVNGARVRVWERAEGETEYIAYTGVVVGISAAKGGAAGSTPPNLAVTLDNKTVVLRPLEQAWEWIPPHEEDRVSACCVPPVHLPSCTSRAPPVHLPDLASLYPLKAPPLAEL